MLFTGSGELNIKTISSIDHTINQTSNSNASNSSQKQIYSKVSEQTADDGTKEATYISSDNAVKVIVTQNSAGDETIKCTVDTKKLENIDVSNVNIGNIAQIKNQSEQYLTPFLSKDEIPGLSAYVAGQALTQYNNKQKQIVISKNFGDVSVNINTDVTTNDISFELIKK